MGEAAPVCPEVAPLVDVTEPVVEPVVEALIDLAPMEPVVDVAPIVPEAPTTAPPPVPAESDDDDDDIDDDDDGRSLRLGARNPLGDAVGRGRRCRLHVLVRCARRTPSVSHLYAIGTPSVRHLYAIGTPSAGEESGSRGGRLFVVRTVGDLICFLCCVNKYAKTSFVYPLYVSRRPM